MTPTAFRALRRSLGYSSTQAAEALRCRADTLRRWERGEHEVPGPAAAALEYHKRLVEHGIDQPMPAPKRGRPPA
jgi:DNA-binding transcriptional regulator YiaG